MSNFGNSNINSNINSNDDPAYKKLREDNKGLKTPSAPPAPPGALPQGLTGPEYEYKEGDEDHEAPELKGGKKQSAIQTNKANLAPLIAAIKKLNASDKAIFKCHGTEFQFRQISDSDDLACMITWCKEVGSDKKSVQPTQVIITSTHASGGRNIEENLEAILVANKLIANGNNDQINNQKKGDFLYIDWAESKKKGQIDSIIKYMKQQEDKARKESDIELINLIEEQLKSFVIYNSREANMGDISSPKGGFNSSKSLFEQSEKSEKSEKDKKDHAVDNPLHS